MTDKKNIIIFGLIAVIVIFGIWKFMPKEDTLIVEDPYKTPIDIYDRPDIYPAADGECPINTPYDPDCPLFCNPSRQGSSSICCVNEEGTAVIPCEGIDDPFIIVQAAVKPSAATDEIYLYNIIHLIKVQLNPVAGIDLYQAWIEELTIKEATTNTAEDKFTYAWNNAFLPQGGQGSVIGKQNAITLSRSGITGGQAAIWSSAPVDMDAVNPDPDSAEPIDYNIHIKVCVQDSAEKLTPRCNVEDIVMTVTNQVISFTVNAEVG